MVNGTDPPIVKPLARRRLKTTAILVVAFIGLFLVSAVWQKVAFYPKVRGAHITVDGRVCSGCAVYVNRRNGDGVFVRRGHQKAELYSVAFPSLDFKVRAEAVQKCVDGTYSFGPGFAFEFISDYSVPRCGGPYEHLDDQRIEFRLIEFTAADGKKVMAAW